MPRYIAAESAPRDLLTLPRTAATVDAAFVIRGGGIPFDQSLQNSWVVEPVTVDGRRFVEICAQDARCKLYFQQNFAMVKYIKQVRDRKVFELMLSVLPQSDPNEDNPVVTSVSDRARRELINQIPKTIDIEVDTRNRIRARVTVVASWPENGALQIELTRENMELLLEEPPAGSARFLPILALYPNVKWVPAGSLVRTIWWDSEQRMWNFTSLKVEFEPDTTNDAAEKLVWAAAEELEQYRGAHHNLENNMTSEWDEEPPAAESTHA